MNPKRWEDLSAETRDALASAVSNELVVATRVTGRITSDGVLGPLYECSRIARELDSPKLRAALTEAHRIVERALRAEAVPFELTGPAGRLAREAEELAHKEQREAVARLAIAFSALADAINLATLAGPNPTRWRVRVQTATGWGWLGLDPMTYTSREQAEVDAAAKRRDFPHAAFVVVPWCAEGSDFDVTIRALHAKAEETLGDRLRIADDPDARTRPNDIRRICEEKVKEYAARSLIAPEIMLAFDGKRATAAVGDRDEAFARADGAQWSAATPSTSTRRDLARLVREPLDREALALAKVDPVWSGTVRPTHDGWALDVTHLRSGEHTHTGFATEEQAGDLLARMMDLAQRPNYKSPTELSALLGFDLSRDDAMCGASVKEINDAARTLVEARDRSIRWRQPSSAMCRNCRGSERDGVSCIICKPDQRALANVERAIHHHAGTLGRTRDEFVDGLHRVYGLWPRDLSVAMVESYAREVRVADTEKATVAQEQAHAAQIRAEMDRPSVPTEKKS